MRADRRTAPDSASFARRPGGRLGAPLRLGRSSVRWGMTHALAGLAFRRAAARGDLMARLELDPVLREDPFPAYEELRAKAARRGSPLVPGRVIPVTVDHAAATALLRSDGAGVGAGHAELPAPLQRLFVRSLDPWAVGPVEPPSMLAVDPPDHGRYRRLVTRAFTARSVGSMEPRVTAVAERLLDAIEADLGRRNATGFELVERYAGLLPVAVIADVLGVPDDQHRRLLAWGNGAARTLDPALTWREHRSAERDVRALHLWFADLIAAKRRDPGDDLISALLNQAGSEEAGLSDLELRGIGLLVLGAGFETTVNLLGNAVRLLDAHPEQREAVRADGGLWGGVVEEVLRFDSPVQATLRQAYEDLEITGATGAAHVPAGQPVLLYLGGANRDPAVFTDPQRFDVTRPDAAQHLAFSSGIHYCLGASLARAEAAIGLERLYARFPDLHLAGPPRRRGTRILRGYDRLPVAA